ncbi:O-antigen ligase family protein [Ramlibacter rhizophilus]|uniref:O-antigen ligase family protein n=1 Tax=Ramlibacter rhizophilus TaxID=1781167 RepID=UPI00143257F2|nr:O-antigen ligase family protein [Ramlibacter rhizophilus]
MSNYQCESHFSGHAFARAYVMVAGLIVVSGSPALNNDVAIKYSLPVFLALAAAMYGRAAVRSKHFVQVLLLLSSAFAIVIFAQIVEYGRAFPWMASLLLKVLAGGLVIATLRGAFVNVYLTVMFHASVLSLVMYSLQLAVGADSFPAFVETFAPAGNHRSIGLHTVVTTDPFRNAGLFWEPGAFQGFLNLGFALVPLKVIASQGRSKLVLMLIALLTTFSTAGYIIFFVVIAVRMALANRRGVPVRMALLAGFGVAVSVIYSQLDFLGPKIREELSYSAINAGDFNPSRSGAFLFDIHYIDKRPLTGNGFAPETRYADHPWLIGVHLGHGNGFSGFLASMGLVGLFGYFGVLWSRARVCLQDRIVLVMFLLLALQSQHFLLLPLFLGLPFLSRKVR